MEQRKKEGTSKLEVIMNNKNITDQELSEKSGVHFNTIINIRKGICKTPKFKTLRKIAKVLGCTPKEIGG